MRLGIHDPLVLNRLWKITFMYSLHKSLSVPWDKGTLSTKHEKLCLRLPRVGSLVWPRTHTPTSYKLYQVLGAFLVGPGSPHGRCAHTGSPLKSLAQMASKPTPDEGVTWSNSCGLATAHLPYCTDATLVGVS
jgi:hypothetical protein